MRFAGDSAHAAFSAVTYVHDCAEVCQKIPHATSISNEIAFEISMCKNQWLLHGASHYGYFAHAFREWRIWGPVQTHCGLRVKEDVADGAER